MIVLAEADRRGQVELRDGRALAWSEWGPVDGVPVLLCPGAATGRSLGFATGALPELGVRVISADRPGLGVSDPAPSRTLLDWPDDVRELLRDRGAEGARAVGYSQGAPFALACAAAGEVGPLAVVAGTDELAHPAFADALDPQLRGLVDAATGDLAAAEAIFAGFDAAGLWEMIVETSSEHDRALYAEPELERALRAALAEGFAQGSGGYARDTALAMAPWPFAVEGVEVPVTLWYGRHDASAVHSPDLGATLERRLPHARRHVLADAGGALLFTHGDEVLRDLLAL